MLFSARDRDILKGCRRTHASPCSSSSPIARPAASPPAPSPFPLSPAGSIQMKPMSVCSKFFSPFCYPVFGFRLRLRSLSALTLHYIPVFKGEQEQKQEREKAAAAASADELQAKCVGKANKFLCFLPLCAVHQAHFTFITRDNVPDQRPKATAH